MSDPFPTGCTLDCSCKRAACIQIKTIKCTRVYYGFSYFFPEIDPGFDVQNSGIRPGDLGSITPAVIMRAWSSRFVEQRQSDGSITESQTQSVNQKNQVPSVSNFIAQRFSTVMLNGWDDDHDQGRLCGGYQNGIIYPLYPAYILEWSITGYVHYDNPDCPLAGGDAEKHRLTMSLGGEIDPDEKITTVEAAVNQNNLFSKIDWGQSYNITFNDAAPPPGHIIWANVDVATIDFSGYDGTLNKNGTIGGNPIAASYVYLSRGLIPTSGGCVVWGITMFKSEVLHAGPYCLVTSVFTNNLGEIEPRLEDQGIGDGVTPIIIPIPKYGAFTAAQRNAGRIGSITRFWPCSWTQYQAENGLT